MLNTHRKNKNKKQIDYKDCVILLEKKEQKYFLHWNIEAEVRGIMLYNTFSFQIKKENVNCLL